MASTNNTELYYPLDMTSGLIFIVISLPGFVANMLAITVTITIARQQPLPPNIFISSLACVDLVGLALTTTPTTVTYLHGGWVGGEIICTAQGITSVFVSIASGFAASLLSLDRFFAVVKPFCYRRNRTQKKAVISIVFVLLFASVFSLLPLAGFGKISRKYPGTYCTLVNASANRLERVYSLCFSALCLFAGLVVIVCNLTVTVCMCKHRKHNRVGTGLNTSQRRFDNEMQYVRTMLIVSLLYIVCWIPFMVHSLSMTPSFWGGPATEVWFARLLVLKFVLDPLAYVLTRKQYRRALLKIVTCCHRRAPTQSAVSRGVRLNDTNM